MEPRDITLSYYRLLYSGDLAGVKAIMTEDSYMMTLESFGLRLSFEDADFKALLKEIREDEDALGKVEELLSIDLSKRDYHPEIEILDIEKNGDIRQTVNYKEAGKVKKLYFSKEEDGWKINYYAGRKVD